VAIKGGRDSADSEALNHAGLQVDHRSEMGQKTDAAMISEGAANAEGIAKGTGVLSSNVKYYGDAGA
jgi:hypothetical protein